MEVSARINQVDVSEVHARPGCGGPPGCVPGPGFSRQGRTHQRDGCFQFQFEAGPKFFRDNFDPGAESQASSGLDCGGRCPAAEPGKVLLLPARRDPQSWPTGGCTPSNGKSERRPVKIGPMNDWEVVIESGLTEGTAVSLNP